MLFNESPKKIFFCKKKLDLLSLCPNQRKSLVWKNSWLVVLAKMSDCWRGLNWASANPVVWAIRRPSLAGRGAQFQLERLFCLEIGEKVSPNVKLSAEIKILGCTWILSILSLTRSRWTFESALIWQQWRPIVQQDWFNFIKSVQLTEEEDGRYSIPQILETTLQDLHPSLPRQNAHLI